MMLQMILILYNLLYGKRGQIYSALSKNIIRTNIIWDYIIANYGISPIITSMI